MKNLNIPSFKKTFKLIGLCIILVLATTNELKAADETFNPGAYIIDMGASNQTIDNGLEPYGLVYDLIMNYNVPVRWAIRPNKSKDQADFIANGKSYKGGSFIIPIEFLSNDIITVLNTWENGGVNVDGPIPGGFIAPIYKELTTWPRAILDLKNGVKIAKPYFDNAKIPSSAYVTAGDPTMLTDCGDIYILPHADPHKWKQSWKTALINYITNGGYLWAGCHAVSALEGMVSGANFLSEDGLLSWEDHDDGNLSYTYDPAYNGDPIMQFIGKFDEAMDNGSEQIFMPEEGDDWRSSTKVAVYQPNHQDADPNEAAVLIYGRAFGNLNSGMVMYEAGHELDKDGSTAEQVAAQRAFFNFILMSGVDKEISVTSTVPAFVVSGSSINISASGSEGQGSYDYEWTSSCDGGTFGDAYSASTTYTAPISGSDVTCVITVKVTDECGRFTFESTSVVVGPADGPEALDDNTTTPMNIPVDIDILDNDTEGDAAINPSTVSFVSSQPNPATEGTFIVHPTTGLVTFTPVIGYTGTVAIDYEVCDLNSLCDIATITVDITLVNGPDAIDDSATTLMNTPVDIDVLDNDTDGDSAIDPTTVSFVTTQPDSGTEGTFTVDGTTGLVTFTPVDGYTGTVTIDYEVCDLNALCDIATITVTITESVADLQISKTGTPNPAVAGQSLTYTITVTNNGPDNAADVVVNDVLPNKLSFDGATPSSETWNAPVWSIGDLANGEFVTLTVTTTVIADATGNIVNTAIVSSSTNDPDDDNNTSTSTIPIDDIPDLVNYFEGTLAFEDLWPGKGDYDFNDLVLDYEFEIESNASNHINKLTATFTIEAFGAGLENGFGFQLSDQIDANDLNVTGYELTENYISLAGNGTENGQSKPTIIVYDNAFNQMQHPGSGIGINTQPPAPYVTPDIIEIVITFPANTYTINDLDIANFNPFLIVNQTRGHEVHLPDYLPTDLVDASIFGTYEDTSDPSTGRYYKTANNLPWAINIYGEFDWAIELLEIGTAHLHFIEWAESNGGVFQDWYLDKSGYRNDTNIYPIP